MKRFKAFVLKEFRHLFRDPRTIIVLLGMPVVQLILFGYVITTEIKNAHIGILDYSKDEVTKELVNKIISTDYFVLDQYINHPDQIEEAFRKGTIKEVLVFEKDFGRNLVRNGTANLQIITDASEPNIASMLDNYTRAIVTSYLQEYNIVKGKTGIIEIHFRMYYNEELLSSSMFVPGTMALILMLISALMTSISIAREKETGTMEILLVSPLRPIQIVLGKVIPYFTLSVINMIVILAIGFFVFEVPIRGNLVFLFSVGLLFIFLALTLGVMISTVARTQQKAMIISLLGLMLPTILLSGFIFPIENLPIVLQWVSFVMPPRWFLAAIKNIMLKGSDITLVWKEVSIMLIMLLFFITVSVRKFKIRLE